MPRQHVPVNTFQLTRDSEHMPGRRVFTEEPGRGFTHFGVNGQTDRDRKVRTNRPSTPRPPPGKIILTSSALLPPPG